jgi:hypothetical protein
MTEVEKVIDSESELTSFVNDLKKALDDDTIILFRGQVDNHKEIRSGKSRPGVKINEEIEYGWNNLVGRILSSKEEPYISSEKRQAILQHYGLSTHYLDLTLNPLIAAWFSVNKFTQLQPILWVGTVFRNLNRVTYTPLTEGIGYIHVLVIPNRSKLEKQNKLLDIRGIEKFERPKKQEAFLLFDRPPLLPDIRTFWKYTLKINRTKFKSSLTMRELFPKPIQDVGYKSLLNVPFVQLPIPEKDDEKTKGEKNKFLRDFAIGVRSINIVDYVNDEKDDGGIDHKWGDFTLYEPEQLREWGKYSLNLKRYFPELDSNLNTAIKITLSPNAKSFCEKYSRQVPLSWPQVESNDILITYAQLEHDKVMDYLRPPFKGIWLHKENDLIVAIKISVGWKKVNTKLYGVFLLKDHMIEPQETIKTKYPKNMNRLIKEVSGILSIHELVQRGPMIFIPHPYWIPKWYFVI